MSDLRKDAEAALGPFVVVPPEAGSRNVVTTVRSEDSKTRFGTVQQERDGPTKGKWVFTMNYRDEFDPVDSEAEAVEQLRTAWLRYTAGKLAEGAE